MELVLNADRKVLLASGKDITFITAEIRDEKGNIHKGHKDDVTFYANSDAKFLAIEVNERVIASNVNMGSCILTDGTALLILQSGKKPSYVSVSALTRGLRMGLIKIRVCRLPVVKQKDLPRER